MRGLINKSISWNPLIVVSAFIVPVPVILGVLFRTFVSVQSEVRVSDGLDLYEAGVGLFDDSADRVTWMSWVASPAVLAGVLTVVRRGNSGYSRGSISGFPVGLFCLAALLLVWYWVYFADLPLSRDMPSASPIQSVMITGLVLLLIAKR